MVRSEGLHQTFPDSDLATRHRLIALADLQRTTRAHAGGVGQLETYLAADTSDIN